MRDLDLLRDLNITINGIPIDDCDRLLCSGKGKCAVAEEREFVCLCNDGFDGLLCQYESQELGDMNGVVRELVDNLKMGAHMINPANVDIVLNSLIGIVDNVDALDNRLVGDVVELLDKIKNMLSRFNELDNDRILKLALIHSAISDALYANRLQIKSILLGAARDQNAQHEQVSVQDQSSNQVQDQATNAQHEQDQNSQRDKLGDMLPLKNQDLARLILQTGMELKQIDYMETHLNEILNSAIREMVDSMSVLDEASGDSAFIAWRVANLVPRDEILAKQQGIKDLVQAANVTALPSATQAAQVQAPTETAAQAPTETVAPTTTETVAPTTTETVAPVAATETVAPVAATPQETTRRRRLKNFLATADQTQAATEQAPATEQPNVAQQAPGEITGGVVSEGANQIYEIKFNRPHSPIFKLKRSTVEGLKIPPEQIFSKIVSYRSNIHEQIQQRISFLTEIVSLELLNKVQRYALPLSNVTELVEVHLPKLMKAIDSSQKECVAWTPMVIGDSIGFWSNDSCSLIDENDEYIICGCRDMLQVAVIRSQINPEIQVQGAENNVNEPIAVIEVPAAQGVENIAVPAQGAGNAEALAIAPGQTVVTVQIGQQP
jgi:hypothetical protein